MALVWRLAAAAVALALAILVASHAAAARKSTHPGDKPHRVPCEPGTMRIVVDVGHTAVSTGADSARNDPEFAFNLRLATLIAAELRKEGFAATRLLVTEGEARPSLFRRVGAANDWRADLLLSIHHDAVPDKFLEEWEFEGAKSHYSDRFRGYSLFVSRQNQAYASSLAFAHLLGHELKRGGLSYARQYALALMGRHRHVLLDGEVGVYRFDQLVVLSRTKGPAVLLEAGSIVNRDEEMAMNSPERQALTAMAVVAAMKQFCRQH